MTRLSALVGVLAFAGAPAQAERVDGPDEPVAALIRAVEGKAPDALYAAATAVGTAGKAEDAVDRLASLLNTCDDPAVGSLARLALTTVSLYAPGSLTRATAAVGAAGDDASRARAALLAGLLGADVRGLAPALRAGLRDKNAVIRNGCLELLAPLGRDDPEVFEDVAAALDDESPEVRAAAVEALASLGQAARKAMNALRKRLDDGDERVRIPAAAAVLGLDPATRGRALEILTAGLTSGKPDIRLRAASTLSVAGRDEVVKAVGPLLEFLRSSRRTERVRSALMLAGIASPRAAAALPALIEGLSAPDPVLRLQSAGAFGRLGVRTPEAVEALTKTLNDPFYPIRIEAAISLVVLGARDTPGVSDPLVMAIRAALPAWDRAASALGMLGEAARPAIGPLVELLGHPNALVREGAARALAAIGPPATNAAVRLADLLGDDDERVRAAAYGLRWLSPGDEVRPRLMALAADPRPEVRERAVTLLAYVGTDGAVDELVRACKTDPARFDAIVEEGPRLAYQGRRMEAERLASVMVRVAEGMGGQNPKPLTSALEKQAQVLTALGRHDQAVAVYRRVRARDEDAKQWDQAALVGVAIGDAYRDDLKPVDARKAYEDAARPGRPEAAVARVLALERLGDLDRAAGAPGAGVARYREALAALPAAREQARTSNDRRNLLGGELAARTGLAYAAATGRDRAGIEEQVAPARAIAAELGPFQAASTDLDLGLGFASAQALDRARALFEAALPPALERRETTVPASRLEKALGDLDVLERRPDAARRHFRAALLAVRDVGPPDVTLDALVGLTLVESQIDRPAAEEDIREAAALRARVGPLKRLQTDLALASAEMNLNHLKEAKEYATAAARSAAGDPSLAAYSGFAMVSVASVDRLAFRFEEALRGYQEALKFGDGGGVYPVTLESHIGSALAAANLSRAADVAAHAGPVRQDAARLDPARRVDALQRLATAYKTLRDFPAALDVLAEARMATEAPPVDALLASVLNATGDVYAADGDWPRAAAAYKDALARATAAGDGSVPALISAHNGLGTAAVMTGHPEDGLKEFQEARRLDHESGNPSGEARDWRNIGNVHRDQGRYPEAEAAYKEAIRLAASAQDELTEARVRIDLAYLLGVQGQPVPAAGELVRVVDVLKRYPDPSLTASLLFGHGEQQRASGLYAAAKKSQTDCQAVVRQYHLAGYEVSLPVAFGNLELAVGHFPEAKQQLDEGLAASRRLRSSLGEASALSSLAGYYQAVGHGDDAVTAARQSEAIYEKAGQVFLAGAEGLMVADSLMRKGEIDAARKKAEEVLNRSRERHLLSLEVSALLILAEIDQQVGDYSAALGKCADALVIMQNNKVVWPHSIERARDLTASAQFRQGQLALALATYQELLAQAIKDGRLERANSLRVTIGGVLTRMGRPDDARVPLEEAERFALSSGNPLLGFDARLALAGLQPPEPGAKEFRALADEARTQGWAFKELSARRDLGGALGLLGDYGGAIGAFERALELAQSLRSPADEGMLEVYLGDTYFTIGDLRQTRNHYLRGNNLARPLGLKTLQALLESRTATVLEYLGRHRDAVMRWREVRRLNREMGIPLDEAMACLGLAASELAAGDKDDALRDAQNGLDLARKHSLPYIEMLALYQLGVAHRARTEKDDALACFADARKVGEGIRATEGVIRADVATGDLYRSSGAWDDAEKAYDRAVRLTEQVRLQIRGPWIQMTLLSRRVSPYYGLAAAVVQSGARDEKRLATAFEHAERAKARVLVDTLHAGRLPTSAATKPEDRAKEKDLFGPLALATEALDRANSSAGGAPGFRKDLLEAYDNARDRYEDFRNNLLLNLPPGDASRTLFKPVGLDALRNDLLKAEPGVCLLSFLAGEDATLLFVVRRGPDGAVTLRAHTLPLPYRSLAAQVGGFREVCKAAPVTGLEDEYRETAKSLYTSLLAPAAEEFHGATHLVISPDGPLNELPFHTLIGEDGRHLVEDYTVSLVPSATTLMGMRSLSDARWGRVSGAAAPPRPQPVAPALALGYPVNSQGKPIAPASTKDEVQRVAGLLHADPLLGREAMEAAAKRRIGGRGIIHFATHGVVNARGRDPLYSYLEMTPGDGEDGYLHAFEFLDVPLTADLVVLSACETAEGSPVAGEGVPGFAWALFSSGASSSIVSLWQVKASVQGATALMLDFYGGLSSKGDEPVNTASALREAQIRKIRSQGERHPYFWAPFVLVGDWRFEPKILRIPNPEAAGQPHAPAGH